MREPTAIYLPERQFLSRVEPRQVQDYTREHRSLNQAEESTDCDEAAERRHGTFNRLSLGIARMTCSTYPEGHISCPIM